MVFQQIHVGPLSAGQLSKLRNGHRATVKYMAGGPHILHVDSITGGKIRRAGAKNKGCVVEVDPEKHAHLHGGSIKSVGRTIQRAWRSKTGKALQPYIKSAVHAAVTAAAAAATPELGPGALVAGAAANAALSANGFGIRKHRAHGKGISLKMAKNAYLSKQMTPYRAMGKQFLNNQINSAVSKFGSKLDNATVPGLSAQLASDAHKTLGMGLRKRGKRSGALVAAGYGLGLGDAETYDYDYGDC